MSGLPATDTTKQQRALTLIIYGLYGASFVLGITSIVAIVLNYIKRDSVAGTVYASHFSWQIRTFWIGLAGMVLAVVTMAAVIGWVVVVVTVVWVIYRLVMGAVKLMDDQPIAEGKYGLVA